MYRRDCMDSFHGGRYAHRETDCEGMRAESGKGARDDRKIVF